MPAWLAFALLALTFAGVATWVSRRLLDTPVGWVRSLVISLVVVLAERPARGVDAGAVARLGRREVRRRVGRSRRSSRRSILGWVFAIVVVVIVVSEFLVPTRPLRNPILDDPRRDPAARPRPAVRADPRHRAPATASASTRTAREGTATNLPDALVGAINEAGVTFVKLGQVLSSREDVLPPQFIKAFSTLQMDSTPIPWTEAEAAIRHELQASAGRGVRLGRPDADGRGIRRAGAHRDAPGRRRGS